MLDKYRLRGNSLSRLESAFSDSWNEKTSMIVVFDTECILCSRAVDFILKREADEKMIFVAAASMRAEPILAQFANLSIGPSETLLVVSDGRLLTHSSAVLEIASHLRFPWNLVTCMRVLPVRLRDGIYRKVALKRYRWFGRASCYLPSEKNRNRFYL